jgi:hypothetical protein
MTGASVKGLPMRRPSCWRSERVPKYDQLPVDALAEILRLSDPRGGLATDQTVLRWVREVAQDSLAAAQVLAEDDDA